MTMFTILHKGSLGWLKSSSNPFHDYSLKVDEEHRLPDELKVELDVPHSSMQFIQPQKNTSKARPLTIPTYRSAHQRQRYPR
jgi:hypothetical protein